mgnify:CR=1 FL=1
MHVSIAVAHLPGFVNDDDLKIHMGGRLYHPKRLPGAMLTPIRSFEPIPQRSGIWDGHVEA